MSSGSDARSSCVPRSVFVAVAVLVALASCADAATVVLKMKGEWCARVRFFFFFYHFFPPTVRPAGFFLCFLHAHRVQRPTRQRGRPTDCGAYKCSAAARAFAGVRTRGARPTSTRGLLTARVQFRRGRSTGRADLSARRRAVFSRAHSSRLRTGGTRGTVTSRAVDKTNFAGPFPLPL